MFDAILGYSLLAIYIFLGLYFNYMLIRDDIRHEKERKDKKKEKDSQATPLRRSR